MENALIRRRQNISNRLYTLRARHALLETAIAAEEARPLPDTIALQKLKRRRLALKEEIASLEALMRALDYPHGARAA